MISGSYCIHVDLLTSHPHEATKRAVQAEANDEKHPNMGSPRSSPFRRVCLGMTVLLELDPFEMAILSRVGMCDAMYSLRLCCQYRGQLSYSCAEMTGVWGKRSGARPFPLKYRYRASFSSSIFTLFHAAQPSVRRRRCAERNGAG
jgi:hypothetical protein